MSKDEAKVERIKKYIPKFPIALKQQGPYFCDTCGQECAHRNAIYSHLKYYHFQNANTTISTRFGRSKTRNHRSKMCRNIILDHLGPYSCDKCGREQKNRRSFLKHVKRMHGTYSAKPKHICSDCGEAFYSHGDLRM